MKTSIMNVFVVHHRDSNAVCQAQCDGKYSTGKQQLRKVDPECLLQQSCGKCAQCSQHRVTAAHTPLPSGLHRRHTSVESYPATDKTM